MKVCFIAGEYPPMLGGVGDYTAVLASQLEKLGVKTCVITSDKASPQDSPSVFPAIRKWGIGSWRRIGRLLEEAKPEIAHIQFQRGAFDLSPSMNFLPLWLHRLGYKVVTTLHDLKEPYLFPRAGALRRLAVAALMRGSNASILTNEEDFVEAKGLAPGSCLSLIPLGSHVAVNLSPHFDRRSVRDELGVKPGDWLLCYFGLLSGSKGVEFLIEAVRQLLVEGLPVKLLIIGGGLRDGLQSNMAYQRQILSLLEQPELREAVIWAGYVQEDMVSALFCASDMCVLPFTDGASFRRSSLISAIAHGIPLVTTAPVRPQESYLRLIHGQNAMLVPPKCPASLANGIRDLVESPGLRQRLQGGALALSQEFSWEKIARQTADLYEQVYAPGGKMCVPTC